MWWRWQGKTCGAIVFSFIFWLLFYQEKSDKQKIYVRNQTFNKLGVHSTQNQKELM